MARSEEVDDQLGDELPIAPDTHPAAPPACGDREDSARRPRPTSLKQLTGPRAGARIAERRCPHRSSSQTTTVVSRKLLRRLLEQDGHTVRAAADGTRRLRLFAEEPSDVVLLDILMPQLDGISVLGQLKGTPGAEDISVIMVSALDETDSVVRCIEGGADDYLPKPFNPVILRARIKPASRRSSYAMSSARASTTSSHDSSPSTSSTTSSRGPTTTSGSAARARSARSCSPASRLHGLHRSEHRPSW